MNSHFQPLTHLILFRYGWFSSLEEACLGSEGVNDFATTSEVTPDLMKELERTSEDIEKPNQVGDVADDIVTDQYMDVLVTPDLSPYICFLCMTRADEIFLNNPDNAHPNTHFGCLLFACEINSQMYEHIYSQSLISFYKL